MAEQSKQQIREQVHTSYDRSMTCSAPSEWDLFVQYWMDFPQYFKFVGEDVIFAPGTPERVLESYEAWKQS